MSTFFALDLGTRLGWCRWSERGFEHGNYLNSKPRRRTQDIEQYEASRMAAFYQFIGESYAAAPFEVVAYERVMQVAKGVAASHLYGAFRGVLQLASTNFGFTLAPIHVGTIKRYWTGHGNASKALMLKACNHRGFNVKDDNEADAIAIMHTYLAKERIYRHGD